MKTENQKPAQQKPEKHETTGIYNAENNKRIENRDDFRKAFRKRAIVVNL